MTSRRAREADLQPLLALFARSEVSPAAPAVAAEAIWKDLLHREGVATFVVELADLIVGTCSLITAPNLLRAGRSHGFLENVVVDSEFRGAGIGTALVRAALDEAWRCGCHHVMLQSGRTDHRVHQFYEKLGFRPGLRTAYVAAGPQV